MKEVNKDEISKGKRNVAIFFTVGLALFVVIALAYFYWWVPGLGMGLFNN